LDFIAEALARVSRPPVRRFPPPQRELIMAGDGIAVARQRLEDATVLFVRGEVDLPTAPALREAVRAEVDEGTGALVVDFTDTSLLGAPGAHLLLNAHRRLMRRRRPLAVVAPEGSSARRTLESVRLLDTVCVRPSPEAALDAVGGAVLSRAA